MQSLVRFVRHCYSGACAFLDRLQSPLLLAIRLYWGWQFVQDGWGKLTHLARVTEFFSSLNLPAPGATAALVASVELVGGILFFVRHRVAAGFADSFRQYDNGLSERS